MLQPVAYRCCPTTATTSKSPPTAKLKAKSTLTCPLKKSSKPLQLAKKLELSNFTVIMLERDRHNDLLARLRKLGVRIILIADGDIGGAIVTCLPDSGIDLLIGAGAGAEATMAAVAVKCLGGTMLVKVWKDKKDDAGRMKRLESRRCRCKQNLHRRRTRQRQRDDFYSFRHH